MSDSRGWIVNTILDTSATPGEVDAAMRAATPTELEAAAIELDLTLDWDEDRQRDLRGHMAHLREQWPGIDTAGA